MSVALAASIAGAVSAGVVVVTIGDETGGPLVLAEIRDEAEVYATGAVDVKATSTFTPNVHAAGGSGAFAAIGAVFVYVRVWGDTRASVGNGVVIDAGSLSVEATNTTAATVELVVVAIGVVAGGGARAESKIGADVVALIGPAPGAGSAATQISTTGRTKALATSSQTAVAFAHGGGGGGVTVNYLTAYAEVVERDHRVRRRRHDDPRGRRRRGRGDGRRRAGVRARRGRLGRRHRHRRDRGDGEERADRCSRRSATASRSAASRTRGAVTGDVLVTAIGRAEADPSGTASGGGVVRAGSPQASSEVDPGVDAHIGTATPRRARRSSSRPAASRCARSSRRSAASRRSTRSSRST